MNFQRTMIDNDGFLHIPSDFLLQLGLEEGDDVLMEFKNRVLRIRAEHKLISRDTDDGRTSLA